MKKKKALYILVPVTLLVWGGILFKILSNFGGDDPLPINTILNEDIQNMSVELSDSFELFLNYPDPFLGQSNQSSNTENTAQSFADIKDGILKNPQKWPLIKYYGHVKNTQTKSRRINLSINQKMYLLKTKDRVYDLRLERIYRDSIIVSMKYETKTIFKN